MEPDNTVLRCSNKRTHRRREGKLTVANHLCNHFIGSIPTSIKEVSGLGFHCSSCNVTWEASKHDDIVTLKKLPVGTKLNDDIQTLKVVVDE